MEEQNLDENNKRFFVISRIQLCIDYYHQGNSVGYNRIISWIRKELEDETLDKLLKISDDKSKSIEENVKVYDKNIEDVVEYLTSLIM